MSNINFPSFHLSTKKGALTNTANAAVFEALKGWWLEIDNQTARLLFSDASNQICIFFDTHVSVVKSEEELESAISYNLMFAIYLSKSISQEEE